MTSSQLSLCCSQWRLHHVQLPSLLRLRNIDLVKANNYRGVEEMTRPPDLIVVLDGTDLLGEPRKLNIPV